MKLIFKKFGERNLSFVSLHPRGSSEEGGALPCLRGMSQNQSLPGTAPWTLCLGSMPCDQMAAIAGNPRPYRGVAYGCLQRPGPTESIKMAGRVVASQRTFLKKEKCMLLEGEPSPGPDPSIQHQAVYHIQRKTSSNLRVPPALCLHHCPCF